MTGPVRVQAHTYDDLLRVYRAIAYQPDHPSGLLDRLAGQGLSNTRYVRELLGLLAEHGLVESREGRDDTLWHALLPDDLPGTLTQAFHATFAPLDGASVSVLQSRNQPGPDEETTMTETPAKAAAAPAKTAEPAPPHACRCGCGAQLTTKGKYAQGHDARHASQVAQTAAGMKKLDQASAYIDKQLPTDKLRAKAHAHAERIRQNEAAKAQAAADKAAAKKAAAAGKPSKPAVTPDQPGLPAAAGAGAPVTETHEGSLAAAGDGAVESGAAAAGGDDF